MQLLCRHAIHLSSIDESSAIDASRPLEQIADACGIAWGSTNVEMMPDLTGFKVLMMTGRVFPSSSTGLACCDVGRLCSAWAQESTKEDPGCHAIPKLDQ